MAKRREARYASVGEFSRDLQKIQANEAISTATPGAYDPTVIAASSRPPAKAGIGKGIAVGVAAAVAVLVLAGALLLVGGGNPIKDGSVVSGQVKPVPKHG